jgi:hypothetical protein
MSKKLLGNGRWESSNRIHAELVKINKGLRTSQIKVFQDGQEGDGLYYRTYAAAMKISLP